MFNENSSNMYNISFESNKKINTNKILDFNKYTSYEHRDVINDEFNFILDIAKSLVYVVMLILIVVCIKFFNDNFNNIYGEDLKKRYLALFSLGVYPSQITKMIKKECAILCIVSSIVSIILIFVINFLLSLLGSNISISFSVMGFLCILLVIIIFMVKTTYNTYNYIINNKYVYQDVKNKNKFRIKYNINTPNIFKSVSAILAFKNYKRNEKDFNPLINSIIFLLISLIVIFSIREYFNINYIKDMNNTIPNIQVYYINQNKDPYMKKIRYDKLLEVQKNESILKSSLIRTVNIESSTVTDEKFYTVIAIGEEQYKDYIEDLNLDYSMASKGMIWYNKDYSSDIVVGNVKNIGDRLKSVGNTFNEEIIHITDKLPFGCENCPNTNGLFIVSDRIIDKYNWNTNLLNIYSDEHIALEKELQETNNGYEVANLERQQIEVSKIISYIYTYINLLIVLVVVLGVLNGINTIAMILSNRRKEFKILYSLGTDKKIFSKMFFIENALIVLKGSLIGTVSGIMISWIINLVIKKIAGYPLIINYTQIIVVYMLFSAFLSATTNIIFKKMNIIK